MIASTWVRLCLGAGVLSSLAVFLIVRRDASSPRWLEAALVGVCVMAAMTMQLVLACVQGEHQFRALNLLRPIFVTISAICLVILWLVVRHAGAAVALGIKAAANIVVCLIGGVFLAVGFRAPAQLECFNAIVVPLWSCVVGRR